MGREGGGRIFNQKDGAQPHSCLGRHPRRGSNGEFRLTADIAHPVFSIERMTHPHHCLSQELASGMVCCRRRWRGEAGF